MHTIVRPTPIRHKHALLVTFLIACVFTLAHAQSDDGAASGGTELREAGTTPSASVSPDTEVFKTRTGKRYHRANCTSLAKSKIPVTLEEAVRAGLTPCSQCKPPVLDAALDKAIRRESGGGIYRVNLAELHSYRDADVSAMMVATVTRHIDGDTVELEFEKPIPPVNKHERIRMIGVDTPETVHPKKAVEYFGKEASDFTKNALLGKKVYVALDWDTRDKYKRLLVYLYTAPGACHNARLIEEGYAHAYTRFTFQFMDEFRALERAAREARRGLWERYSEHSE